MIRKLLKDEKGNIQLTLDLKLDGKAFKNLSQAREFIIKNQTKIENLITKFAIAKTSLSLVEINGERDKAVVNALKRLGII